MVTSLVVLLSISAVCQPAHTTNWQAVAERILAGCESIEGDDSAETMICGYAALGDYRRATALLCHLPRERLESVIMALVHSEVHRHSDPDWLAQLPETHGFRERMLITAARAYTHLGRTELAEQAIGRIETEGEKDEMWVDLAEKTMCRGERDAAFRYIKRVSESGQAEYEADIKTILDLGENGERLLARRVHSSLDGMPGQFLFRFAFEIEGVSLQHNIGEAEEAVANTSSLSRQFRIWRDFALLAFVQDRTNDLRIGLRRCLSLIRNPAYTRSRASRDVLFLVYLALGTENRELAAHGLAEFEEMFSDQLSSMTTTSCSKYALCLLLAGRTDQAIDILNRYASSSTFGSLGFGEALVATQKLDDLAPLLSRITSKRGSLLAASSAVETLAFEAAKRDRSNSEASQPNKTEGTRAGSRVWARPGSAQKIRQKRPRSRKVDRFRIVLIRDTTHLRRARMQVRRSRNEPSQTASGPIGTKSDHRTEVWGGMRSP